MMRRVLKYHNVPGGFTLIEVVIIIAIISVLASIAVPYAFKLLDQEKRSTTMSEMESLYRVITGDPASGDGGYVGDMGTLPLNNDLRFLNQRRVGPINQQGPQTDLYGVKYGWYGPYMNAGFDASSYLMDGWGVSYQYGAPGAGQIRSAGEDRAMGTPDDLTYPPSPVNINGRLSVNVYTWDGAQFVQNPQVSSYPSMSMSVTVFFSNQGVRTSAVVGSPASPPYTFLNLHLGQHAVVGSCDLDGPGPQGTLSGVSVPVISGNNSQTVLNLYLR